MFIFLIKCHFKTSALFFQASKKSVIISFLEISVLELMMSIPREAPKPSCLKSLLSRMLSLTFSLILSSVTVWLLTLLYPYINPAIDQAVADFDPSNSGLIANWVWVIGAFIIGMLLSGGVSTIMEFVRLRRGT
jgi:hypothetical protein